MDRFGRTWAGARDRILAELSGLRETARDFGLIRALRELVYAEYEAVPAVCDLEARPPARGSVEEIGCELAELAGGPGPRALPPFAQGARRDKAPGYLDRGFRAFMLVSSGRVVGDVWCATGAAGRPRPHPVLARFAVDLNPGDVYLFDLYLDESVRGRNHAAIFMQAVHARLREAGCARAYGCYFARNIPALWLHRRLGYRDLPRVRLRRILFIRLTSRIRTPERRHFANGRS